MSDDVQLHLGDALTVLRTLETASADAVVTDPPAGIGFMGKTWDKPGVLGVSGGRAMPATMASRNPMCRKCHKHERGKAPRPICECPVPDFDTQEGRQKERQTFIAFLSTIFAEALRVIRPGGYALVWAIPRTSHWTATALEDAGWEIRDRIAHIFGQGFPKGQGCLKPAVEDWWLCRAPGKGVRPLGIDECRVEGKVQKGAGAPGFGEGREDGYEFGTGREYTTAGRWPSNLVLSHHPECNGACHEDCPVRLLDEQAGPSSVTGKRSERSRNAVVEETAWGANNHRSTEYTDSGNVSRFFYCPKASRRDRGEGNTHPTVKNTRLMEWLVKLVCSEGGLVLDPFAGSGTTLVAAAQAGRRAIGIELDATYFEIARKRIAESQGPLFAPGTGKPQ